MTQRTQEILTPVILGDVLLVIIAGLAWYFRNTDVIGMGENWWTVPAIAALVIVPFVGLSVAKAIGRDRARREAELTPPEEW